VWLGAAAALIALLSPGWWRLGAVIPVMAFWAFLALLRPRGAHADRAGLSATSPSDRPAESMMLDDDRAPWAEELERRAVAGDLDPLLWATDFDRCSVPGCVDCPPATNLPSWADPEADRVTLYGGASGSMGADYGPGPFCAAPTVPAGPGDWSSSYGPAVGPAAGMVPGEIPGPLQEEAHETPAAGIEPTPGDLALAREALAFERAQTADAWEFISDGWTAVDKLITSLRADLRTVIA